MPRSTSARKSCQARLKCAFFARSGSWQSRISRCIARQPSPPRESTFSSIPCDTWKRDVSRSGGAPIRRLKVCMSQLAKLCSGGLRFTTFLPSFAFSPSRRFSITCSGACATTKPRSSKPFRPARPAIWWKSRADRTAVFCPSNLQSREKSTVRIGTLMPTPERVGAADDLEQPLLRELLDEHAVLRQQARVMQPDALLQPLADVGAVRAGEAEAGDLARRRRSSPRACRRSGS